MNIEEQFLAHKNAIRAKRGDVMFDDDSSSDDGMNDDGDETTEDDDGMNDDEDTTEDDDVLMEICTPRKKWERGTFSFFFYYMGQGDCTMIVCPDQTIIMIDCGSAKAFSDSTADEIRNDLRAYSPDGKTIHHLIFTHEDHDHYNQLANVFNYTYFGARIAIQNVYFSHKKSDNDPLGFYTNRKSSRTKPFLINEVKPETINEVNINSNGYYKNVWYRDDPDKMEDEDSGDEDSGDEEDTPQDNYAVIKKIDLPGPRLNLTGSTDPSNSWSADIICGNVQKNYNKKSKFSAIDKNTFSLCTLFTRGGKKALLLGDATKATTDFMMSQDNTYKSWISNLDLGNVAHHGSKNESPTSEFIQLTQPKYVIESVQIQETGYHLPAAITSSNYAIRAEPAPDEDIHLIDVWEQETKAVPSSKSNPAKTFYDANKDKYSLYKNSKNTYIINTPTNEYPMTKMIVPKAGYVLNTYVCYTKTYNTGQASPANLFYIL